ncbi:MAG TPA: beta-eliminating lyase-related protein, partial [Solirubrobacteraceae bacterium]
MKRTFASDNYAGMHPAVLAALGEANEGHAISYGDDPWTARLQELIRTELGEQARAFPVFNGTGANVLAIEALTRSWEAAIVAPGAHLNVDEGGAPERAGRKLLVAEAEHGRLSVDTVARVAVRFGDEHAVQPKVVSLTQSTELGTVYAPDVVAEIAGWCHDRGMLLHVDGARLANAAAALDLPLGALTTDVGVDAVSFGATKNGAAMAEAVVFLRDDLGEGMAWLRKQSMQLASKMRFLSAQLVALLSDGLWRRNAAHANAMAARLSEAVAPHVEITHPVEANGVFAVLPPAATERLQRDWRFYVWDEATGEVRWLCSWDTTPED